MADVMRRAMHMLQYVLLALWLAAWIIVLSVVMAMPVLATECNAGEVLEWDAVPGATQYVVFASVEGGDWFAVAALDPMVPGDPPVPRTWAEPSLYLTAPSGTQVTFAVGFEGGTPYDPPPDGFGSCLWVEPCAMGFGGSDPRADMLACVSVP